MTEFSVNHLAMGIQAKPTAKGGRELGKGAGLGLVLGLGLGLEIGSRL